MNAVDTHNVVGGDEVTVMYAPPYKSLGVSPHSGRLMRKFTNYLNHDVDDRNNDSER